MVCLSYLDAYQKQLFLEVILEEAVSSDPELMAKLMKTAMEVFNNPIPLLDDPEFLKEQKAFKDAYRFLDQEEKILAVPTLEVNKKLYLSNVPDFDFIKTATQKDS